VAAFEGLGLLAIAAGGLLAAFSARRPTRLKTWMSAYLVLVAGLVQFGLAVGWQRLGSSGGATAIVAFVLFNIGNIFVMLGTAQKQRWAALVRLGGLFLAVTMLLLAWAVKSAAASWTLAWFLALVLIILVTMPIGLTLSARRKSV
jgi:hypothetical protein